MAKAEQGFLFDDTGASSSPADEAGNPVPRPLAVRMRPQRLADVVGHEHLLGKDSLLPRLIATNSFGSLLFYGPPGCGKTTMAEVIANETGSRCIRINAVLSNVAELRDILKLARQDPSRKTILFIDEIHRFNKAQQDLLLPDVEQGNVRLIGATTHNPGFYIIPPLLSRSHLFRLEPLSEAALVRVLERALNDSEHGLGAMRCKVDPEVLEGLAKLCEGDVRRALTSLETLVMSYPNGSQIGKDALISFARERQIRYDANEDEHYDTASAFIKSIRGCDPDAALYWLAKMLEGGEDPRFIARRLVILASEDVGLADPRALPLAVATFHACEIIGLPECQLNLAHCVLFLATCPKSNSATVGIARARQAIREEPVQSVPPWLRDSHNKVGKQLGYGAEYLYSHEFPEAISGQEYMLEPKTFYQPISAGAEASIAERLKHWRALKQARKREAEKRKLGKRGVENPGAGETGAGKGNQPRGETRS